MSENLITWEELGRLATNSLNKVAAEDGYFTNCRKCGEDLFGGEASGPEANGLCDSCNNM